MKFQVGIVIVTVCFIEFMEGSCLSYGHSCWGAHGKRANSPPIDRAFAQQPEPLNTERWALVKILTDKNKIFPLKKILRNNRMFNQIAEMPDVDEKRQFPGMSSSGSEEEFDLPNGAKKFTTTNDDQMATDEDSKIFESDVDSSRQYDLMKLNRRLNKFLD